MMRSGIVLERIKLSNNYSISTIRRVRQHTMRYFVLPVWRRR